MGFVRNATIYTDNPRLILYFPVSSLVTLFANILQNPQDARARSDVKLMNQVVNFLSLLAVTEEQGGVKRMLGVCAEFERIARVVLEKSDKESHSRRKRRSSKINESDPPPPTANENPVSRPPSNTAPTSQSDYADQVQNIFTPGFTGELNTQPFDSTLQFTPSFSNMDLPLDFSGTDFNTDMLGTSNGMDGFQTSDINGQFNIGSFQQPFVPQDLWQMPMTLEWDLADMSTGGANGFPPSNPSGDQGQGQNQ